MGYPCQDIFHQDLKLKVVVTCSEYRRPGLSSATMTEARRERWARSDSTFSAEKPPCPVPAIPRRDLKKVEAKYSNLTEPP